MPVDPQLAALATHVGGFHITDTIEARRGAIVLGQECEKRREVAAIGVDGVTRRAALGR